MIYKRWKNLSTNILLLNFTAPRQPACAAFHIIKVARVCESIPVFWITSWTCGALGVKVLASVQVTIYLQETEYRFHTRPWACCSAVLPMQLIKNGLTIREAKVHMKTQKSSHYDPMHASTLEPYAWDWYSSVKSMKSWHLWIKHQCKPWRRLRSHPEIPISKCNDWTQPFTWGCSLHLIS